MHFSHYIRWSVPSLLMLLFGTAAHAQHDAPPSVNERAYGVNRRVETGSALKRDTIGYGGISGSFAEPSMALDSVFNPTNSSPQFYLGLGYDPDVIQIDAGLVYEARSRQLGVADHNTGKWQSFFEYKKGAAPPVNQNGKDPGDPRKDWSTPRGSLGTSSVDVHVEENGTAVLSVSTGSATSPQDIPRAVAFPVTIAVARGMYAKRVTAMTQAANAAGYTLDDTWIEGSTFDIDTISTIAVVGGQFKLTARTSGSWDASISLGTGYTPRDKDATGRFIVDFPGTYKRNVNGSDPERPADYYSKPETVDISLRKAPGRVRGIRVQRGGHR